MRLIISIWLTLALIPASQLSAQQVSPTDSIKRFVKPTLIFGACNGDFRLLFLPAFSEVYLDSSDFILEDSIPKRDSIETRLLLYKKTDKKKYSIKWYTKLPRKRMFDEPACAYVYSNGRYILTFLERYRTLCLTCMLNNPNKILADFSYDSPRPMLDVYDSNGVNIRSYTPKKMCRFKAHFSRDTSIVECFNSCYVNEDSTTIVFDAVIKVDEIIGSYTAVDTFKFNFITGEFSRYSQ